MRLLLDTHVVLWTINADDRLPPKAHDAIEDVENDLFLSIASLWEAAIKIGKGKLRVPGQSIDYLIGHVEARQLTILPITLAHLRRVQSLPPIHGDPFDRMLVAQAQSESLHLLTNDADIARYDVPILWP